MNVLVCVCLCEVVGDCVKTTKIKTVEITL